ncbi:MAG: Na/Pi cotransporter family protein [Bauldia sp.]|nr:Na/Pi cotransporter family protein [Bauldia sp.]
MTTTITSVIGGGGLILLGMWMMTDGLKVAAGNALQRLLDSWTRSALRGVLAGALITAIVQSSSAVTFATIGLVNAGLLSLSQAVWLIFGTNVGTTMTSWLVALVGVRIDVEALALPLVGLGMLIRLLARSNVKVAGGGLAAAGFGTFFLGIGILQGAFSDLGPQLANLPDGTDWVSVLAFVLLGFLLTLATQSSSAAIAVILTASATGEIPLVLAGGAAIGANLGTTSTALLAAIGATAPAKRVAAAHVAFNLLAGLLALALLPFLIAVSEVIAARVGLGDDTPGILAIFHTMFNLMGVVVMVPFATRLIAVLSKLFVSPDEEIGRPRHLDPTVVLVPALALQSLSLEADRMKALAFDLAQRRLNGMIDSRNRLHDVQEGILKLGLAMHAFIGQLSRQPLPDDDVESLADIVRAIQHLQDLLLASETSVAIPDPAQAVLKDEWQSLTAPVSALLVGNEADPGRVPEHARRAEEAYQAVKTALLRATARGQISPDAADTTLVQAQRLRRAADAAFKAERRLAHQRDGLEGAS